MKRWILIAMTLVSVFNGAAVAQNAKPGEPVTIDVKGPLILGFFPPFTKAEESEPGITEGLAHVQFALQDIANCYGEKIATYRLDVTRSVTLRDGKRTSRIRIPPERNHGVGIILAMPGRPARTIFASVGPSSLITLGPSAAAEYFGAAACRRDE